MRGRLWLQRVQQKGRQMMATAGFAAWTGPTPCQRTRRPWMAPRPSLTVSWWPFAGRPLGRSAAGPLLPRAAALTSGGCAASFALRSRWHSFHGHTAGDSRRTAANAAAAYTSSAAGSSSDEEEGGSGQGTSDDDGEDGSNEFLGDPEAAPFQLDPSDAAYWRELCEAVTRPHAVDQAIHLVWDHPLGAAPRRRKGGAVSVDTDECSTSTSSSSSKARSVKKAPKGRVAASFPCYSEYLEFRRLHPRAVIVMRVGDFYEAVGFDAVLLMEHCGLNAMAGGKGVARAGCPHRNLRRTLAMLVDAGLTAAVVEESDPPVGSRSKAKIRTLRGIVSPAAPDYLYGLVDDETGAELAAGALDALAVGGGGFLVARPILGLSPPSGSSTGWTMFALDPTRHTLMELNGLSEEAMWAHIGALGAAPPLLVHKSSGAGQQFPQYSGPTEREFRLRVREAMGLTHRAAGTVVRSYQSHDAADGFVREALMMLGRDVTTPVERLHGPGYLLRRGPTVFHSTARQLGLMPTPGIPSLQDHVMAPNAPVQCRHAIRHLLLLPPSPEQASQINEACRLLGGNLGGSPPTLSTDLTADLIARVLIAREGSHTFLLQLVGMMEALATCLDSASAPDPLRSAASAVVSFVAAAGTRPLSPQDLLTELRAAVEEVLAVVPYTRPGDEEDVDEEDDQGEEDVGENGGDGVDSVEVVVMEGEGGADDEDWADAGPIQQWVGGPGVFRSLQRRLETHSRVKEDRIRREVSKVTTAAARAQAVLDRTHEALQAAWSQATGGDAAQSPDGVSRRKLPGGPRLKADYTSRRVWVHWPSPPKEYNAAVDAAKKVLGLQRIDSTKINKAPKGGGIYTTPELDAAFNEWDEAAAVAADAARDQLRVLCDKLVGRLHAVTVAASASVLLQTLMLHVEHALQAGWTRPTLLPPTQLAAPATALLPGNGAVAKNGSRQFGGNTSSNGNSPSSSSSSSYSSSTGVKPALVLRGTWPYWMDVRGSAEGSGGSPVVTNNIELTGMALLTGPNMAGKSTVLRTICSSALLANCGLMVPAEEAVVPHFTHFALRNFSGDAPAEGMSAFGVEMRDMANVLQEATALPDPGSPPPSVLALVDELGKGTEVQGGTALAGAMLEAFVEAGVTGVFASHLHLLQDLPLREEGVTKWRMGVEDDVDWSRGAALGSLTLLLGPLADVFAPEQQHDQGGDTLPYPLADFGMTPKRPTWRIEPGICSESMALETALRCGLPCDTVRRAAELMQAVPSYSAMSLGGLEQAAWGPSPSSAGANRVSEGEWWQWEAGTGRTPDSVWGELEFSTSGSFVSTRSDWGLDSSNSVLLSGDEVDADSAAKHATTVAVAAGTAARAASPAAVMPPAAGSAAASAATAPARPPSPRRVSPPVTTADPFVRATVEWLVEEQLLVPINNTTGNGADSNTNAGFRDTPLTLLPEVVRVGADHTVQPAHVGRRCIYVVRWRKSKLFYGGCTENIKQRRAQHVRTGGPLDMVYVALDGGPGSGWVPREGAMGAAEGEIIRRLRDAGFPMSSVRDGRRKAPPTR